MGKAQQALSANLAALNYALGQSQSTQLEDAPLQIQVTSGRPGGSRQRRREDPERADAAEMSLEYTPGKPLNNFGRLLAHSAGIPLPYNMRQSAEAADAARIDWQNQNDTFGAMADTFQAQMEENALNAADAWGSRMYTQYADAGRNATTAFFAENASAEQRAAAYATLSQLDQEARAERNKDATDSAATGRKFMTAELGTSRGGIINRDMAENDRIFGTEAELAQLDNVPRGSAEEKIVLRAMLGNAAERSQNTMAAAARGLGSVAGAVPNPYAAVAGAGLQAIGAVLQNESVQLDRDTVVKMVIEQNDALDSLGKQLRDQLVASHEQLATEAAPYGVPGMTWSAPDYERTTPYIDAWRSRLYPSGGSESPQLQKGLDKVPQAPTPGPALEGLVQPEQLPRLEQRAADQFLEGLTPRRPTR